MSEQQQMEALALANAARTGAVKVRDGLHDGSMELVDALEDPLIAKRPLERVLRWLPNMGSTLAEKLLEDAELTPWDGARPVGALNVGQRAKLVDAWQARERRRKGRS